MEKVCVVGLGTVGMPVAQYINECAFEVCGLDVESKSPQKFPVFLNWEKISSDVSIYVITVDTGWRNNGPDVSQVESVCKEISKKNTESLICIESTVPVGTCRRLSKKFLLEFIVHVPHRFWVEDPVNYGVKQQRVIGAINEPSLRKALKFYNKLELPLYVTSSIEVAELSKIAENANRFVQIAFAEELKMICDSMNIPFEDLRRACNTKWNIEIFEARNGISGSCLPKDIRYLSQLKEKTPLLNGAIDSDILYKNIMKK